ncbi:HlyD family type I secretion periplasmic adaptor subunit [Halomonas sp. MCCC 1A17488]|uniref:Membrane fusion protein (MFP) family protein n=1 Tax=Billgrantia sulfidoxydans TaxID=2733484 RepID=A0ABX7W2G2_9GAMM|nr:MULTISPECIES: HlyD family type I secretion periplasmic adaptor subunit [Halomonas]MCE8015879.1 HlyD family type I secretion periplasmic adaptor subunit [Halomonas sp. MCCC 1A17488]MCG3239212.1 HlyD family type I secretion periplasmic adaptor subunit [Halomonas sp. MCCC 1A17488]QPP50853.1 HlyD family type I secretion periplasmic adaptor subunit [Halomonas sp. SS10-MC5]QTP54378.1 HlyD family type I secretion periplasmic adaptor subunit [Halomonas sulfidoxydans]
MNREHLTPAALPIDGRRYRHLGLLILLIAFGGFGGWALAANLAVAVVAPGKVSVASFKKTVQHYEGGIVSEIRVADGDHVEAGEVLVVLDNTRAASQLQLARTQYLINRASEVRLTAELAEAATLAFPEELLASDSQRVSEVLAVQHGLFFSRRQSLQGTLETLDQQTRQYEEQREGLESLVEYNRRQIASLREEADDLRSLFERGHGDRQRLRELERDILELEGETAQQQSVIARIAAQISENELQKQIHRQEFQAESGEQLREVQEHITDAEERITALADEVRRTTVTAPVAGTVVGMQLHTLGAVIGAGDPILELVPSDEGFVVEARVPASDVDSLYVGQAAEIRFSAFNQGLTHAVDGEVIHVSADSFEDERTGRDVYRVRIRVTEAGREEMTSDMRLLAGMPAEVMIHTGERTFASYLVKPIGDVLARAMRD